MSLNPFAVCFQLLLFDYIQGSLLIASQELTLPLPFFREKKSARRHTYMDMLSRLANLPFFLELFYFIILSLIIRFFF